MAERTVGLQMGRSPKIAVLRLELDSEWVHLHAIADMGYAQACRTLYHLHLQYHAGGVPHRISVADDATGLQYIDGVSVQRPLAEEYLLHRLTGLADIAETGGVH